MLLDVDGVLIDVRASFREAVRETVVRVARVLGRPDPWRPTPEDIGALKAAGGFNDDIDVSIALTAVSLARREADFRKLCTNLDVAGGGLSALRTVAPDLPRVPGADVLATFLDLYWGPRESARLRGLDDAASRPETPRLIDAEVMFTDAALPARLREAGATTVGVISGRTPRELNTALDKLGWARGDLQAIVTGDIARKPDPVCVDLALAGYATARAVYVGDVRDDWELVRRHRAERSRPAMRSVIVGSAEEVAPLRALGCDATIAAVDDLPALLRAWGEPGQ